MATENSAYFKVESGFHEEQGKRDTMEDAHVIFNDIRDDKALGLTSTPAPLKHVSFFGVYDGHGGKNAADLVRDHLHKNILTNATFPTNINAAIEDGFKVTDEHIVTTSNADGWMNGSTGVIGLIADEILHIANVGDSEACLAHENEGGGLEAIALTTPHKASDPNEKRRIESLGGHVFFNRVFGALAVSRSFGDSKFKKPKTTQDFVSCIPAMKTQALSPKDKFIILACDGLWDVMDHSAAIEFVRKHREEKKSADEIAKLLVREAIDKKTEDNVTVIIVFLEWDPERAKSYVPPVIETLPSSTDSAKTTVEAEQPTTPKQE